MDDTLLRLTDKQCEALALASMHLTSKEIALRLNLSPSAVDQRLDSARKVLGATSRGEAVRKFRRYGAGKPTCRETATEYAQVPSDEEPEHPSGDGLGKPIFRLEDAATFSPPAPWHHWLDQHVPELDPKRMGVGTRLALIVWGAVGLLVLFGLLGAVVIGLNALI